MFLRKNMHVVAFESSRVSAKTTDLIITCCSTAYLQVVGMNKRVYRYLFASELCRGVFVCIASTFLFSVFKARLQSIMVEANSLLVPGAIVVSTTAAIAGAVQLYRYLQLSSVSDRSTTSSAGGGAVAYETSKAVDEYVQMHFALPDEVFPYKNAPKVRRRLC